LRHLSLQAVVQLCPKNLTGQAEKKDALIGYGDFRTHENWLRKGKKDAMEI
jgi:hypothetical protein